MNLTILKNKKVNQYAKYKDYWLRESIWIMA